MDAKKSIAEISEALGNSLEELASVLVRDDMNGNHFRIRPLKTPWDIIPRIVDIFPEKD